MTIYAEFADKQQERHGSLDKAIAATMQLRDNAGVVQQPFYHAALAILRSRRRAITAHGLIGDDLGSLDMEPEDFDDWEY